MNENGTLTPTQGVNVRELSAQFQRNCARIDEICDVCEKENRQRNDAEEREYQALCTRNQQLLMRMQSAQAVNTQPTPGSVDTQVRSLVREAMNAGSRNPVVMVAMRDIQTTAALSGTGVVPVRQQEFLKPIRAGLIWGKVGIPIRFGLIGTLRWPVHGKATAAFVGEGESLTAQNINWDKIEVAPKRLGAAVEVTNQELFQSEGIVESAIAEEIPMAIIDKINDALFCTDKTGRVVWGPFAEAGTTGGCKKMTADGAVPTRRELLMAKAEVAAAGINTSHCCWVMTEAMKAELEATPVDAGSGRFLCEDDKVLGYPVFTTSAIGESNIGFGDWSYQAAGFFGQARFTIDPYSLAFNDSTRVVHNTDFATVTLRPEAFVLIAVTPEEDREENND